MRGLAARTSPTETAWIQMDDAAELLRESV